MSGDEPAAGGPAPPDGLADALGHLQVAALSMVAAVRSALDVAERLARDPAPLLDLVAEAARAARPSPGDGADAPGSSEPMGEPGGRARPAPRVQHIVVAPPDGSVAEPDDEAGVGQAPR